jgi:hypothetical protein
LCHFSQPWTPFEGHPNVQWISLPNACETACCSVCLGANVVIAGWGRIEGNIMPDNLMQLSKFISGFQGCERFHLGSLTKFVSVKSSKLF